MNTSEEILLSRFWSHSLRAGERAGVIVKNTPYHRGAQAHLPALVNAEAASINWRHCGYAVASIMAYLRKNGFRKGDKAAILAWNCPEWVWADLAIQGLGGASVPIYPHSSPEQVNFIVQNSGASYVFSNEFEQLKKVSGARAVHFNEIPATIQENLPGPRAFIDWFHTGNPLEPDASEANPANWQAVKDELARVNAHSRGFNTLPTNAFLGVTEHDLATIIYTSGSTGVPKGVGLTHGNIASACRALTAHGFTQDPDHDLYLSYLPLAHVYERVDGMSMSLWHGVPVAFCKVDEVGEALKFYRPSILLGVPAVWRKMKDKIEGTFNSTQGIKRWLIDWALTARQPGFKRWLADKLVFSRVRSELGGSLRILLSGGAPISPDVIDFFNLIGLELLQGYGLTETSGGISTNRPSNLKAKFRACNKVGSVGPVIPNVEIMLVQEEGGEPDQGEIWIRGPLVFTGYWGLPEENGKAFSEDRWFKTGDLGRIDNEGFLHITGRKKRQMKTDGGKYVPPEKIEKSFEGDAIVQYVVPVGDGKPFISALIFINQQVARQRLGRELPEGVDSASYLAEQPEIVAAVQAAVNSANAKLERWETLKKFRIVPVEASVGNGLLTPTLKIRSEEAGKRFAALVDEMYATRKAS